MDGPVLSFAFAQPYAFSAPRRRTALLLIDLQRDFLDPSGFGAIQCGNQDVFNGVRSSVVPGAQAALAAARRLGLTVVHTREGHRPDLADLSAAKRDRQKDAPSGHHTLGIGDAGPMGPLLVRGAYGHDLVDELQPVPGEVVVDKPGKGSFWDTDLHRVLMARGITHLLVGGVTTECCVTTTAREAADRGFQCCILADCTSGFDGTFVDASLAMIASFDGLFGFVAKSTPLVEAAAAAAAPPRMMASTALTPPGTPPTGAPQEPAWDGSVGMASLTERYQQRTLQPEQVVRSLYAKIQAYEEANPHVWIHLRPLDDILQDAQQLSAQYATPAAGSSSPPALPPLYGIPFAVKDNFDVAGIPTTAACPAYAYTPAATAPTVAALQAAGAILLGKTNMDQLATGLSGCRSPYGNPCSVFSTKNAKRIAGGSSSGSAVAVAAGLVTFALGTDTAGSGRVPAALNGIVGYKPTKGTLSGRGIVPACKSLDTASVFAAHVEDARKAWCCMDVYDARDAYAKDPAVLPKPLVDYRGVREAGFRVAVPPKDVIASACTTAYAAAFAATVGQIEAMGGTVTEWSADDWAPFQTATELLYSGTLVNERIASIGTEFILGSLAQLHPTTQALFRAVVGRDTKPWEVFEDMTKQREATRKAARLLARKGGVGRIAEAVDVLVLPTVPDHPTVAAMEADPIGLNAKMGAFTHFGNVLDLCTISVPAGTTGDGTPFGLSLACAQGQDGYLFDVAREFEQMFNARKKTSA